MIFGTEKTSKQRTGSGETWERGGLELKKPKMEDSNFPPLNPSPLMSAVVRG